MRCSITLEQDRFVAAMIASGRYQTVSEVFRAGLRLLERGLAHDLGLGSIIELRFEPSGLSAVIVFAPAQLA